jgi:AcrR family transcriptional regulator
VSKSNRRSRRERPVPSRQRGPRFNHETRDATATRIQKAAVQLVKEEGLDALNFRSLGARPELDITGTAPLYYFGSKVGLLGAVAEQGFGEVAARLRDVRSKATPGMEAIVSVSIAYAQFGLENPRLYQAIHTAELWHSAVAVHWRQQARLGQGGTGRARPRICRISPSRVRGAERWRT